MKFSWFQVVPQSITLFPETTYQPKLTKTPSMRAMINYYNMPTDNRETVGNDNLAFLPEDDLRLHTPSTHPTDDYYSTFGGSNGVVAPNDLAAIRTRFVGMCLNI